MTARSTGSAGSAVKMTRCRGFTLFEMVIAVSIFALMGVVAFGGLGQMTRTGQAVADANDRLADIQFAVAYFNRDWTQVSPRKIRNQYGDEEHNIVISDAAITFTRSGWSNLFVEHKRSTLQRLQYLQVDDQLVRRHWRWLDQGIGEKPLQTVLLDDIEGVEIEFLDALGQPVRNWPLESGSNTDPPIVLMLRLDLPGIGEITRLLEIPDGVL